jgi:hypothetical protein
LPGIELTADRSACCYGVPPVNLLDLFFLGRELVDEFGPVDAAHSGPPGRAACCLTAMPVQAPSRVVLAVPDIQGNVVGVKAAVDEVPEA